MYSCNIADYIAGNIALLQQYSLTVNYKATIQLAILRLYHLQYSDVVQKEMQKSGRKKKKRGSVDVAKALVGFEKIDLAVLGFPLLERWKRISFANLF